MKNKSGNTSGQQKRDSATRSAGNRATGNRNKHLLAAERRRTDEADGRLNKQNPVSPQNNELNKSKNGTKQNAGEKLFPCKIKIDDTEVTSQQLCSLFGFAHRHLMFNVALLQIEERGGKIGERTPQ